MAKISSHAELKKYLGSKPGKALLDQHGLRKTRGPIQRLLEAMEIGGIAIHKKGKDGTFNPLGEIVLAKSGKKDKRPRLVVFHNRPRQHPEKQLLTNFANVLGTRFELPVKHKVRNYSKIVRVNEKC